MNDFFFVRQQWCNPAEEFMIPSFGARTYRFQPLLYRVQTDEHSAGDRMAALVMAFTRGLAASLTPHCRPYAPTY
jgi:hypothetical protein